MPFVHGNGIIHISQIDACTEVDDPLYEMKKNPRTSTEDKIGKHIANLVDDGATLQMGIGGIPDAALSYLCNHKNLGIHTEMCSDGIIDLVENGVINGSKKETDPGKIVSGFAFGTKRIYDFIDKSKSVI